MPLGSMYVEPNATTHGNGVVPVQTWFDEQLAAKYPAWMVVSADFGHGKSLSARRLACRLALHYLQAAAPSSVCWYPVYVRAAEDLTATNNTVEAMVARAMRRQANDPEGLQLGLALRDEALTLPNGRALVIIDGFDEVLLEPAEIERFFGMLNDESSETRRFVVLGRPESLRDIERKGSRYRAELTKIQPFDDALARRWLDNWNLSQQQRRQVEWAAIEQTGLGVLACTPVLLFMVAFALSDPRNAPEEVTSGGATALYERFCRALARGKLTHSGERHLIIERSAGHLADKLEAHGWALDSDNTDPEERLCSAMLWLMSRIAWETYVRGDQPMKPQHVEAMLERLFELDDPEVHVILVGSLLALQSNLASGQTLMFFGHRSIQEYLAARFWHLAIDHISSRPSRALQRELEGRHLIGAELLNIEQSLTFLRELEERSDDRERAKRVHIWADSCFCDLEDSEPILKQRRPLLRASALAIACMQPGFDLTRPDRRAAWMSLLPFNWISLMTRGRWLAFSLPDAKLDELDLRAANLHRASMPGASLVNCILKYVNFGNAKLDNANMTGANLEGARFEHASLRSADLQGANIARATFCDSDMSGAVLKELNLGEADFARANLEGADLEGINWTQAKLEGAKLAMAKLSRAYLAHADLRCADLRGARLVDTALHYADLTGADVTGTDLYAADLTHARLPNGADE